MEVWSESKSKGPSLYPVVLLYLSHRVCVCVCVGIHTVPQKKAEARNGLRDTEWPFLLCPVDGQPKCNVQVLKG